MAAKKRKPRPTSKELVDRTLGSISSLERDRDDAIGAMREHRDHAVERLLEIARSPESGPTERINAAYLLFELHELAFWEVFVDVLENDDDKDRLRTVLRDLGTGIELSDEKRELVFSQQGIVDDLLRLARHANRVVANGMLSLCARENVPGGRELLEELIEGDDVDEQRSSALFLSWEGTHQRALEVLIDEIASLEPPSPRGKEILSALVRYVEKGAPDLKARAEKLVGCIFLEHKKCWIGATLTRYLRHASEVPEELLWSIARGEAPSSERGSMLVRLARGGASVEELGLQELLNDRSLDRSAGEAYGVIYAGTENHEVIDLLASVYPPDRNARAILAIGGDYAGETVEAVTTDWPKRQRDSLLGKWKEPTVEDVLVVAAELGLIDSVPEASILERIRDEWGGDFVEEHVDLALAHCGVLVWPGEDLDRLPAPHDELVAGFARMSEGRFAPEDIEQEWNQQDDEDFEADYTVSFHVGERGYAFRVENHGDRFDSASVARAVNSALADAGVEERFVGLRPGRYLLGRVDDVQRFAQKIRRKILPWEHWSETVDGER